MQTLKIFNLLLHFEFAFNYKKPSSVLIMFYLCIKHNIFYEISQVRLLLFVLVLTHNKTSQWQ